MLVGAGRDSGASSGGAGMLGAVQQGTLGRVGGRWWVCAAAGASRGVPTGLIRWVPASTLSAV